MTLFEYLAIAFSLLFTLAAMRIVGGIPYAVVASSRYWLHLLLIANVLYFVIALFWNFWSFRDIEWTQYSFLLALAIPSLIYAIAVMVIPENPSSVTSWRNHYFNVRTRVYSTLVIWGITAAIVNMIVLGQSWGHPSRFFQASFIMLYGVLAISERPRVHAVILPIVIAINVMGLLTYGYRPSWLT
jgi:hypothetical protein